MHPNPSRERRTSDRVGPAEPSRNHSLWGRRAASVAWAHVRALGQPKSSYLNVLLAVQATTGAVQVLRTDLSPMIQLALAVHLICGPTLFLALILTLLLRKRKSLLAGRALQGITAIIMVTGLGLAIAVFKQDAALLRYAHTVAAWTMIALVLSRWAGVAGRTFLARHRVDASLRRAGVAAWPDLRTVLATIAVGALVLLVLPGRAARIPKGYSIPYGSDLFLPSQIRTNLPGMVNPAALAGSAACGAKGCHPTIYSHWRDSAHRFAGTDPFYGFVVDNIIADYGWAAARICVGCHDPILLLSGGVDSEGRSEIPESQEGISCLVCHATSQAHNASDHPVPANGSLTIDVPSPPLFSWLGRPGELLAIWVLYATLEKHRTMMGRPLLKTNEFCATCHQFYLPVELVGQPPAPLRLQQAEWEGTPFADRTDPRYLTCIDCHAPLVDADDPAAVRGKVHDHRFPGANAMVPWMEGNERHYAYTVDYRQRGWNYLDPAAFRPSAWLQLEVEPLSVDETENLARQFPGRETGRLPLAFNVAITNVGIGHDYPTGATDISETWLEVKVSGSDGTVLHDSGWLDEECYLDPRSYVLDTRPVREDGLNDGLHDLFDQVGLHRKRRIHGGDTHRAPYLVPLPERLEGEVTVEARLLYRRGNQHWNDWNFAFDYSRVPITELCRTSATLTLPPGDIPRPQAPPVESPPCTLPGMVWVPGGPFWMGADWDDPEALNEEKPAHVVDLPGFFIDRTPVTMADYSRFLVAMERKGRRLIERTLARYSWNGSQPPPGPTDRPAVLVTCEDAREYCRWLGKRLPTEAEWEKAARGTDNRRYAWGDEFDPQECNTAEKGIQELEPVGSHPANASPYGALDMGCNVFEWTDDYFYAYPKLYLPTPKNNWILHYGKAFSATRGSSYESGRFYSRITARSPHPDNHFGLIGFRCAVSGRDI